jgi:hypothetical protein
MNRRALDLPFFLILAGLATACNRPVPNQPEGSAYEPGPVAWIDAPLDGSTVPQAPLEVVWHASDPSGVALTEFSVDGQVVSLAPAADGRALILVRQPWAPPGPGTYRLQVRAKNASEIWSEVTEAQIEIAAEATPAGPEPTPTPAPTPTAAPVLVTLSEPSKSESEIYFHNVDCSNGPDELILEVTASDPTTIRSLEVYYRLRFDGGETGDWDSRVMNPRSGGRFSRTLQTGKEILAADYLPATLLYQFVATQTNGEMLRSPVYSDVRVPGLGCGG